MTNWENIHALFLENPKNTTTTLTILIRVLPSSTFLRVVPHTCASHIPTTPYKHHHRPIGSWVGSLLK